MSIWKSESNAQINYRFIKWEIIQVCRIRCFDWIDLKIWRFFKLDAESEVQNRKTANWWIKECLLYAKLEGYKLEVDDWRKYIKNQCSGGGNFITKNGDIENEYFKLR